jgi:hypothetical protein
MQEHHRGVIWPVLLIGAGSILLLNNLGYLSWDIWGTLWRLWPVLLIAAGLEIIVGRRSFLGSALVALVLLAVFLGAIWWGLQGEAQAQPLPVIRAGGPQELRTIAISQPLEGAAAAVVSVGFGAGQLRLDALPASSNLVKGQIELNSGEEAEPEFDISHGVAHFTLQNDNPAVIPTLGVGNVGATWDLKLNRDVPTQLEVSTGAGDARLDLTELNLTQLDVKTGVGRTQLFMPRRGKLEAQVESAVGELTIVIPPDVGARIEIDGGLGSVNVGGKEYTQQEDVYTSSDYHSAPNRVDLSIDAGIGSVIIR